MTIAQKRESNKRQRPDSNSDRISPLYKTRNIKNQNNFIPENSIFTTPDSSKETFEIDPFNETYLKCCHESIKHYIDNTLICKCTFFIINVNAVGNSMRHIFLCINVIIVTL